MASRQLDEEEIFHIARKLEDEVDRNKYLGQICAGDQALRERVEALLTVHEQEQQFLNSAPEELPPTVDQSPLPDAHSERLGDAGPVSALLGGEN